MFEHVITDTLEHTLSDENHHSCINKCGNNTQCKNRAKNCQCFIQLCKVRIRLSDQRNDKIIQQEFQGQRDCNTCHGTDKDADKYDDKLYLMCSCHIFQKSFGSFDGVLVYFFLLIHRLRLL